LYDLIKKNATFAFGVAEHDAFETLKRHLASKPVLAIYSLHAETEHCDVSASGFDGILLQKQNDGGNLFFFGASGLHPLKRNITVSSSSVSQ